jgi:hypothetical protein
MQRQPAAEVAMLPVTAMRVRRIVKQTAPVKAGRSTLTPGPDRLKTRPILPCRGSRILSIESAPGIVPATSEASFWRRALIGRHTELLPRRPRDPPPRANLSIGISRPPTPDSAQHFIAIV